MQEMMQMTQTRRRGLPASQKQELWARWKRGQGCTASTATPGALVGMWAAPEMTLDHFCFSALVTLYIVFGVSIEERDLVAQWGDKYLDYAKRVRSIVPVIRR
jgi:hypothetical protein